MRYRGLEHVGDDSVLRRAGSFLMRTLRRGRWRPVVGLTALAALPGGLSAQLVDEAMPPLDFYADSASLGPDGTIFQRPRFIRDALSLEADEALATGPHYETSEWTLRGNVRLDTEIGVIEADKAQGDLNFADNEWRFSGEVRMSIATAMLWAEHARFTFEAGHLAAGELTGAPAIFEAHGAQDEVLARGSAKRFQYAGATRTLRLIDDVMAQVGPDELTASELLYDLVGVQVVSAESIHMRLDLRARGADQKPVP
jgi:lipopolysaccharide transport protein LptA